MNTTRQLLLDNDTGSDRLKFEYDFNYGYENNKATFTCRRCGKHEYRNGEFETIKMGDIFTHITHFPSGASPGGDNLCTQCLDVSGGDPNDQKDTKPIILATKNHNNNNSLPNQGIPVSSNSQPPLSQVDQLNDASIPTSSSNIQSTPTITYSVLPTVYGDNQDLTANSTSIGNNHQESSHFHSNSVPSEPKYTISMVNSVLDTSQSSGDSTTTFIISHTQQQQQQPQQQQQQPQVKQEPSISSTPSSPIVNINNVKTPEVSTASGLSNITNNNTNSKECQICNKTFKNNKIAQLHFQRVHEKIGRYCCHICGIRFSYRGSLDSHLASHTTPEVTHNCPACGQKFKEKSNLTNHMKIHSDNPKKFLCDFCPSGFSKRVNLRYHMKRKHPDQVMNTTNTSSGPNNNNNNNSNNNNNNTQSSGMSAPQSQPTQLSNMSHTYSPLNPSTTKTSANSKDKPQGNFKCEHCGRTFLFKNNLKAHLRTHTRDKKYTCEICEKSFIYKESLKNHMLLHSNELPYLCDICGKKFRDRSNRRKHVKNVHKYMFMNGDASTAAGPTQNPILVKNGETSTATFDPSNNNGQQVQQNQVDSNPPKKKRNNKKNNPPDINDNKRTIIKSTNTNKKRSANANNSMSTSNNSKANSNPRNNNKSVIVSTASNIAGSLGVDQDRKIIMSPSPKSSSSPLEYSHLPVTVHVPASPAGSLHQHYVSTNRNHNVIVKASSTSSPPDMDLYHRSQNVIVYPKSKGNINVINDYTQQNTVISHNNMLSSHPQQQQSHVSQPQYYTEDSYEARAAPPTYMTLPLSNMASSPPDSNQNSNLVYEFGHPTQGTPIKIEADNSDQNHSMQATLRYDDSCGGDNSDTVQYSSSIYSTSGGEPSYHIHHPEPEHQYWTSVPQNDTNNSSVAIPTNVSPPYSTPSSTNSAPVSYDSPITAASNVLNAPSYAQSDIVDPVNSNFFYKDLSQFDFSYL